MSSAERYLPHYKLSDYQLWKGDWELIEGIPIAMTPSPFGRHQRVAHLLAFELENAVRQASCTAAVLHETDWIVSDDTVVRPDVVLVCGEVPERHIESPPALVAEVLSPSTEIRDLTVKKQIYQREGVSYYLIVDPALGVLTLFHNAGLDGFHLTPCDGEIFIKICAECQLRLDLMSIFRSP